MRNSLQYCSRLILNICCRSLGNFPDASAGSSARKVNLFIQKDGAVGAVREACPLVASAAPAASPLFDGFK